MRRHIVLLFLLVAVFAVTAAAQTDYGYPPELYGVQLFGIEQETEILYTNVENAPFSMPDLVGHIEPAFVRISLDAVYLEWLNSGMVYHLAWTPACQCYATWWWLPVPDGDEIGVIVLTGVWQPLNNWMGYLREGTLEYAGHPPVFWDWKPGALKIEMIVDPRSTDPERHDPGRPYSADE